MRAGRARTSQRWNGVLFAVVLLYGAAAGRASAQCIGNEAGPIDFRGRLGSASGASLVQIFPWSDAAAAYADNLERQLGANSDAPDSAAAQGTTLADLETATAAAKRIPAALASASTAPLVNGQFSCNGFSAGRYLILAQVQGGSGRGDDPKALIAYYRADVDTSSIRRHVTVIVTGFRRIASYPPILNH